MLFRNRSVHVKTAREIEHMRTVGRMAAETLHAVGSIIRAGLTTEEINDFVHRDTLRQGARPAPLNYLGFPKSVCTSVNHVVCHGIPGPSEAGRGDIINVDVTHLYQGFHGIPPPRFTWVPRARTRRRSRKLPAAAWSSASTR
jgi:methionyl aminopeptidase